MSHFQRIKRIAVEHHRQAAESFHATHRHAKRLLRKHKVVIHKIRHHTVRTAAVAGVSAGLLAGPVLAASAPPQVQASNRAYQLQKDVISEQATLAPIPVGGYTFGPDKTQAAAKTQAEVIPEKVHSIVSADQKNFSPEQEQKLSEMFQQYYGIDAKAELDGIRLNVSQGLVGGEQLIPVFPGDRATSKYHTTDKNARISGMVPKYPAWGPLEPKESLVTQKDIERSNYYFVVQTFLSPGWEQNYQKMYPWFRHRKVAVLNPDTGNLLIGSIEDSGPGKRTGKNFGASPQGMEVLQYSTGPRKGRVIVFFLDDPDDKIPLGPRSMQ